MISNYVIHLTIFVGIYIVLTMSMNLAVGFGGMLNLAHVAFWGIGAYASALLAISGMPYWAAFLAGGAFAGFAGFLLSFPTIKMKGDYLVLGTLGFSIIAESVMKNWTSLTRGPLGLPGIPKPELFGITFDSLPSYALLILAFVLASYAILKIVVASPFGRILKATRDDELAAKTLGKDTFMIKAKALTLSAVLAGFAGSLYAHYITFIDPTSFSLQYVILVLSMVLVGGTGSLAGSIAGAIFLVLLPEPLRFLPLPGSILGGLRQALYAIVLILVVMKRPQGLIGEDTLHEAWSTIKKKVTS